MSKDTNTMSIAMLRSLPVFLLPLALAACGGGAPDAANDSRQAEGEVLEGSISDDMIPLDQLRSQGQHQEASPSAGADEAGAAEETGADAGEAAPGETPAESVSEPDEG